MLKVYGMQLKSIVKQIEEISVIYYCETLRLYEVAPRNYLTEYGFPFLGNILGGNFQPCYEIPTLVQEYLNHV